MNGKDDGRNLDAMLRHLGSGRDLREFPGTTTEKLALIRTAGARRLIEWRKTRARYELTSYGWNALMPARRFGVASLMISAATGGMAGAVAAAVLWLPADASRHAARGQSSASISRLEPRSAPLPAIGPQKDAAAESDTSAAEGLDPPKLADRPTTDSPMAQVSGVKESEVKKPRHKAAHHRRREQGRMWAAADPWRAQSIRYAGYGGQRGWFGYR